ncbi:MAG: 4Fe-4S binding protein [Treponema sp.]|jgi:dissimilatory sulfite reductase (desulfoviridin) alpha/beta subunit|nr:4Fe-4S binding protein [Treponema sp.]
MSGIDYAALKKGGFMRQRQKDHFSMRLKVIGGQLSAAQVRKIGEVADKYGRGYIHLTSRQGVEIPFIALEDIDRVKEDLAAGGVNVGVCGPRVRTITACQGSGVCPSGIIETSGLAEELDKRYFGQELPHKFKIGITGCKNNCLKAEENDLGIKGGIFPQWDKGACTFCGLCEAACPVKLILVDKENRDLSFDEKGCVYCGKCVKGCPADAWKGKNGYLLSFGGMFGNEIKEGLHLLPLIFDTAQVFKAADAVINFYRNHAKAGERLGRTITRVGTGGVKKELEEAVG